MNKIISRLMLASATVALSAALAPMVANAADLANNNGLDQIVGNLVLGNGSGDADTYTITGDTAVTNVNFANPPAAGQPNGALIVGNGGLGVFTQGDGTDQGNQVNVAGDLAIGHLSTGQGAYNLNTGSLTVGGQLSVGGQSQNDQNVFNQYSGSVTLTGSAAALGGDNQPLHPEYVGVANGVFSGKLAVGGGIDQGGNDGGHGTYNLYGGTIDTTANGIEVGASGVGIMNQSGDGSIVNTQFLTLGFSGNGTYNLSLGTIHARSEAVGFAGIGAFNQSGGLNAIAESLTVGANSAGNAPSLGPNIYTLTGGTLTTGDTIIAAGEQGDFVINDSAAGAFHNVNGNLVVGTRDDSGFGHLGTGTYTITGNATLNVDFAAGGNGSSDANGPNGRNANGAVIIGEFGTGTFTQGSSDGSDSPTVNIAGDLSIGHQGAGSYPSAVTDSVGTYTINSGNLTVGGSIGVGAASQSDNVFTQNGGVVTVAGSATGNADYVGVGTSDHIGSLFIGGAAGNGNDGGTGTYNMNGGELDVNNGIIEVGHAGTGTFNQAGGTVNASTLWLGNASNSSGVYNLDGGTMNAGSEVVGLGGDQTNVFNHTNGLNQASSLEIGVSSGTTGIYSMEAVGSGASPELKVNGTITVGEAGQGEFKQTLGKVTAANLVMGTTGTTPNGSGSYSLTGTGSLHVTGDEVLGQFGYGDFTQGRGSIIAARSPIGFGIGPDDSTNTVDGSLIIAASDNIRPNNGNPPRGGLYTLNSGTLSTTNTYVGELGDGKFVQNGGTHTVSNDLIIAHGAIPLETDACDNTCVAGGASTGRYDMNGGTLNAGGITVGDRGVGTFNIYANSQVTVQSSELGGNDTIVIANQFGSAGSSMTINGNSETGGPTVSSTYMYVGAGAEGSLTINDGTLNVTGQAFIGGSPDGIGHVTQNGGSFVAGALLIGTTTDSLLESKTGHSNQTYDMTGGSLTAGTLVIGSGNQNGAFSEGSGGTFTQTGAQSSVQVDAAYVNNGTYNFKNGSFTSLGFLKVGDTKTGAMFNQTGGNASISGNLEIGGTYAPALNTIAGTYNLSGGELLVGGDIIIGEGTHGDGIFNYTGGNIGFQGEEGTNHQIVVGQNGKGTFNLGSADNTVDLNLNNLGAGLVIGQNVGSNGTFNVAAGSSLEDSLIVGDAGTGTFDNSGGTHSVTGDLILGNQTTGKGTYNLTTSGNTSVSGTTVVGNQGTGAFVNDASTLATQVLAVASGSGSTGTYTNQNGGSLKVGTSGITGFADIGQFGNGKLIQNGATSSTTVFGALDIGRFLGGTGEVDLNGGTMTVNGFAVVGDSGTGTFNQGGTSTMNVVDGGLYIGRGQSNDDMPPHPISGTGTYTLSDTASLTSNAGIYLGQYAGNTGTFNQNGGTIIAGSETIGQAGVGHWNQTAGTNTVSGAVIVNAIGAPNGSSLTISSGSLNAAIVTNNDLMTMTGGTVTAPVTNNHEFNLNGGTVVGSVINNANLDSNGGGTASITGSLTNAGTTHVSNNSTVTVGGGVSNSYAVTVDAGSKLDGSGSSYTQSEGVTKVDGQLAATIATITLGTLEGKGTITGNLSNVGGTVKPGDGATPGALLVTGTYDQQVAAIFETAIAGTDPGQVSRLNVGGHASLGGTLDVELVNGFTAALGDLFNVMNFASFNGDFSAFSLNGNACTSVGVDQYSCSGLGTGLYFQEIFAEGGTALNLLVATSTVTPPTDVPEPLTITLFTAGIGGVVVIRRRRKAQKA